MTRRRCLMPSGMGTSLDKGAISLPPNIRKLGITVIEASAKDATNVEEAFYGVVRSLRMRQRAASGSRRLQEGENGADGNLERDRQRENGCGCIVL